MLPPFTAPFVRPLQARPTERGPKRCLLFMPTLLPAITIHIHMKSQSSPEQLSGQKKPGPAHPPNPPTPIYRPHRRSLWPSVGNNKPKPFKQSFRQQGRESYGAKIQRFTSHGVPSLASFCFCSALPEVKRREREGQCNWPHNAKSPCSSERERAS